MLGRWMEQLGMLPKAWLGSDSVRPVQLRRWAIIAIVLFVAAQSFFWVNLYETPYAIYLLGLAFMLNPVFTYCMLENFGSTASRYVRAGLWVGCWIVYPLVLTSSIFTASGEYIFLGLATHIIFDRDYGMARGMEAPVSDLYIATTILCSIGALAGASLVYLSTRLVLSIRKICLGTLLLPKAWFTGDVQLRRWVIIAIALFAAIQHFLWGSLDDLPHDLYYFFIDLLNLSLSVGFTYCLLENLGSATSRGVRTGLRVGCWIFYLLVLMLSVDNRPTKDYSAFDFTMHIMFSRVDGTADIMGSPIADMYITTTALCSIGALAGALLGYLSDKLVDGVRKICKRLLGG